MWIQPVAKLKLRSHLETRLQLRDEAAHARRLFPWLALVNVSFGFVDWAIDPADNPLISFLVRGGAAGISRVLFLLGRGRMSSECRLFCTVFPYMGSVEYMMFRHHVAGTPYFAGLSLVMVTSTMLFPARAQVAARVYGASILPVLICLLASSSIMKEINGINIILMAVGSVYVCAVNSGQTFTDLRERLRASEALARDLGKRDFEIRQKAEELIKRKVFESQLSPQVVSSVLKGDPATRGMLKTKISTIVIDIKDSTAKANSLSPSAYKQVVEEMLDVFSAACLKWDITLDKFTGDGVQAFAGAPNAGKDDLRRAVMACKDAITMFDARKREIESLWREPLQARFAVCEGSALVGFIGRGVFKSFTAVGDLVSLTHRLSAVPDPWSIAVYSSENENVEFIFPGFHRSKKTVTHLKGFGEQSFQVTLLYPTPDYLGIDAGRCNRCGTPHVMDESPQGIPKIYCPACNKENMALEEAG